MELDVAQPLLLAPGEGETTTDRPERTLRILVELEALIVTWFRYEPGEEGPDPHCPPTASGRGARGPGPRTSITPTRMRATCSTARSSSRSAQSSRPCARPPGPSPPRPRTWATPPATRVTPPRSAPTS